MYFGLLLGGYVASPVSDIEADASWVWSSVGDVIFRPIQVEADSTWTWSSSGNLTVAAPTSLEADSTWTWSSTGNLDEAERGPRNQRGDDAGSVGTRGSLGVAGGAVERVLTGVAGAGGGR